MTDRGFRFDRFLLDPADRRLMASGVPVELNARYLDALSLMVRDAGTLVTKDRFLDEVWRGVPVTDEALTQCIKTLRRQLGDDASNPRFIETVPKHGYRFIAAVETVGEAAPREVAEPVDWRNALLIGGAGTLGGGTAGVIGGLIYGSLASAPQQAGMGAASVLVVLLCITTVVALLGAAGVAIGIVAANLVPGRAAPWTILGGALGGLVVGAIVKMLGLDAFNLLFGRSPGDITGAAEGTLLGGAVGLGAWLAARASSLRTAIAASAICGGAAGILIHLLGGRLMGGSLDLIARNLPGSRLRLDEVGGLFGESGFGPVSQLVTAGVEGALFAACLVGAMLLARQQTMAPH